MGWFQSVVEGLVSDKGFSSPLGDGLVLLFGEPGSGKSEFSSPSGDGLVRLCYCN